MALFGKGLIAISVAFQVTKLTAHPFHILLSRGFSQVLIILSFLLPWCLFFLRALLNSCRFLPLYFHWLNYLSCYLTFVYNTVHEYRSYFCKSANSSSCSGSFQSLLLHYRDILHAVVLFTQVLPNKRRQWFNDKSMNVMESWYVVAHHFHCSLYRMFLFGINIPSV